MLQIDAPATRSVIPRTPFPRIRRLSVFGGMVIAVFIGGFGVWSAVAPLKSAARASGVVAVESNRKTIQHLESGIIGTILVRDGDAVSAGQPVIQLDDTKARTTLAAVQGQLWDAHAAEARLEAERDDRDQIRFPDDLVARADDPVVARTLKDQRGIFASQRTLLQSNIDIVHQRIAETHAEIDGLKAEVGAADQQSAILQQEISDIRPLVEKSLERKPALLSLERDFAQVAGQRGETVAQIARAEQSIAEADMNVLKLRDDAKKQTADALRAIQQKTHELQEEVQVASDVMARTTVRTPEAGVVTDLRVHTPGGVVSAGEPLMDIVPQGDRLIIEARVRPQDIDVVHVGLPARVWLLPYNQRRTPAIDGKVTYVSADRLVDKSSTQPYYAAKIRVDEKELARLKDVEMLPGMPSEVMIDTGKTRVALYALAPILDSFHRAFREQ